MNDSCPLCSSATKVTLEPTGEDSFENLWKVECQNCTPFCILGEKAQQIGIQPRELKKASAILRQRSIRGYTPVVIVPERSDADDADIDGYVAANLKDLIAECPQGPVERIELALLNIADKSRSFGAPVSYDRKTPSLFFALEPDEFTYIAHLLHKEGYVDRMGGSDSSGAFRLNLKGWEYVRTIRDKLASATSMDGFVAMSFDAESQLLYDEAIDPAVRAADFNPKKVDRIEHNNQITDEIIILIRGARFLIAEMTGQNHGVYWEAGFARGLRIPVIFCCRKDEVDEHKVHFDIRQFNHVVWSERQELRLRLEQRIRRTIL